MIQVQELVLRVYSAPTSAWILSAGWSYSPPSNRSLGVYIDETQVDPETTVGDLEALLAQGSASENERFPSWSRTAWCRAVRSALHYVIVKPGIALLYQVQVHGRENLDGSVGAGALRCESQSARGCRHDSGSPPGVNALAAWNCGGRRQLLLQRFRGESLVRCWGILFPSRAKARCVAA